MVRAGVNRGLSYTGGKIVVNRLDTRTVALDANTGRGVWKAFNSGPDKDVLIGPTFKPFYPQYRGKDLGVKTWPADQWKLGGATVWGWVT